MTKKIAFKFMQIDICLCKPLNYERFFNDFDGYGKLQITDNIYMAVKSNSFKIM